MASPAAVITLPTAKVQCLISKPNNCLMFTIPTDQDTGLKLRSTSQASQFHLHTRTRTRSAMSAAVTAASPTATSTLDEMTQSMDKYFGALTQNNQYHLTKLHVYIQVYFKGSDIQTQTVHTAAATEITDKSPSNFGRILYLDNPVTVGPDPDSPILGRYQGSNVFADLTESAMAMNMNMIFTAGEYAGSTISIVGRQPYNWPVRAVTIAGGTGSFCLAQGVVIVSPHSRDVVKDSGTYMYVMYIVTPVVGCGGAPAAD